MKQKSAEYDRRSAEAQRRSAETQRRSAETQRKLAETRQSRVIMAYFGLYQCTVFYTLRNVAQESETDFFKDNIKESKDIKEFKIDYHSLLPTEVQRFFDLSPVQQNSITCDKAKVKILNIVLQEIVKLYNLYQKTPQAKRKIKDIKTYIDAFKENNIDYKSKLSPEILKFFGTD